MIKHLNINLQTTIMKRKKYNKSTKILLIFLITRIKKYLVHRFNKIYNSRSKTIKNSYLACMKVTYKIIKFINMDNKILLDLNFKQIKLQILILDSILISHKIKKIMIIKSWMLFKMMRFNKFSLKKKVKKNKMKNIIWDLIMKLQIFNSQECKMKNKWNLIIQINFKNKLHSVLEMRIIKFKTKIWKNKMHLITNKMIRFKKEYK